MLNYFADGVCSNTDDRMLKADDPTVDMELFKATNIAKVTRWLGTGMGYPYNRQGYFYQISKGGHLRFWTFLKTKFAPFEKIVDLSVCRRVQRSRYLNLKVHNCGPFCIRHVAQRSRYLTKHPNNI